MQTATPIFVLVPSETHVLKCLANWAVRAVFLFGVILALASQATAAPVVFAVSGGNPDESGMVMYGTLTIDTATGKVLSADVTVAHVLSEGGFTEYVLDHVEAVRQTLYQPNRRGPVEVLTQISINGGVYVDGPGLYLTLEGSASLDLSSCLVSQNAAIGGTAGAGVGGGMEDTSSGTLTVTHCTFDRNEAIATGPNTVLGIPGYAPGFIIALGGGIDLSFVASGSATISDSTFTSNQALGGTAGASAGGGALSNSSNTPGTTMTVTGCTLSGNAAIGDAGGDGMVIFGSGQCGGINEKVNVIPPDLLDKEPRAVVDELRRLDATPAP